MLRSGVPPALRCAVWLSNVMQAVHPHRDPRFWHEYRTLAKVRALDAAYESIIDMISKDETSWELMTAPSYGRAEHAPDVPGICQHGRVAWKRVLVAAERVLSGVDFCPILPSLTALLLTSMSESYAFCALREMAHESERYFAVGRCEYLAWQRAFCDVLSKLHHSTYEYLEGRGVLDDLPQVFQDFFVGILPTAFCLRILDIYTLEGSKVLYRFGVALLVLYRMEAHEKLITISNADEWWTGLRTWTHGRGFNFDFVVRKAYGVHGRGLRKQLRFPRRTILSRIIKMEQARIVEDIDEDHVEAPPAPLGLVPGCRPLPGTEEEEMAQPLFAQSTQARLHLAEWLPMTLRMTNLELLYSTNHHGRSLEMFYTRVKNTKHTILMCEVFGNEPTVIGMYASQVWRPSTQVYGDGGCFLFRLQPNAKCWKWKPRAMNGTSVLDAVDLESDNNETALLEQFMVGTRTYISMGGNEDGSAGLRLNEDFTRGESSTAVGFRNDPLHGASGSVFEVGLVEVYGLVRQIDGRAI